MHARHPPGHPASGEVWEVFARHDREPAVKLVGAVRAVDAADARVFALLLYDERRWRELFVVPRAAVVPVVRPV